MSQDVPLKPAHLRQFTTLKIDSYGNVNTEEGYDRAVEPVPKMLEQIADQLIDHPEATGNLKIDVKFPLSISCQYVICQFHQNFPNITLQITDWDGKVTYIEGDIPPQNA